MNWEKIWNEVELELSRKGLWKISWEQQKEIIQAFIYIELEEVFDKARKYDELCK